MGRPAACNCKCAAAPVYATIGRPWGVDGPQATAGKGEDTAWTWGPLYTGFGENVGPYQWVQRVNMTSGWFSDPDTGRASKSFKMHPMRWIAQPYSLPIMNNVTESVAMGYQQQIFPTVAQSALTPDVDSHLYPFTLAGFSVVMAFPRTPTGYNESVYGFPFCKLSKVKWWRLLLDGVDVSGIVAADATVYSAVDRYLIGAGPTHFCNTLNITLASPISAVGKTIAVDLWLQDTYERKNAVPSGQLGNLCFALGGVRTVTWFGNKANVNANRGPSDRYQLTFDAAGPGGVSSVVLEPTAGWTFSEEGTTKRMLHIATGDVLTFNWGFEHPQILINKPSRQNLPYPTTVMRPICAYYPSGSADFIDVNYSAGVVRQGVWNPASSTFPLFGRYFVGVGRPDYYGAWANVSGGMSNAIYTGFPHSISVVKL